MKSPKDCLMAGLVSSAEIAFGLSPSTRNLESISESPTRISSPSNSPNTLASLAVHFSDDTLMPHPRGESKYIDI